MTRLEDWIAVLAAAATIVLSLALAILVLHRGSSPAVGTPSAVAALTTIEHRR
jgi:hypothetical protein